MSMFDGILVRRELLDPLLKSDTGILNALQAHCENGYYDFQTKDLENALYTFYLEEDKKLRVQKYNFVDGESSKEPISFYDVTTYVSFYTNLGIIGDYDVFITFKAHFVQGICTSIVIESIEETSVESIRLQHQEYKHRESFLNNLFCYRLAQKLTWIIYDLERWFRVYVSIPGHSLAKKLESNAISMYECNKNNK